MFSGEEKDKGGAKGIEVRGGRGLSQELFEGGVAVSADAGEAARRFKGHQGFADGAKVDKSERVVGADDDVGGFDVAMEDGRGEAVDIREDVEELSGEGDDIGFREAALFQVLFQVESRDKFADQGEGRWVVEGKEVAKAGDGGMV